MPQSPRTSDRSPALILALASLGVLGVLGFVSMSQAPDEPEAVETPDRFVEVQANPDAGEGAKREEGVAGRSAKAVDEVASPPMLTTLRAPGDPGSDISDGIGGLVGAKGVQIGSGGLGTRGSGIGGGGVAEGLGGLGTKGRGSGSSGYGSGGGVIGARGEGGVGSGSTSAVNVVVKKQAPVSVPSDFYDDPSSNSEQYTDYGVNRLTITDVDRHSTFAVDVDTASYSISRRKIQSGSLPPAASVRVEEFVNAIDYDYEAPTRIDPPFAVFVEAAPSPFEDQHHILRVGLKGAEPKAERRPWHLTFLVDTSGSMNRSDKLPLAQESLKYLVDGLGDEDTIAIATYAGSTRVVLEPTPSTDRASILAAIDSLQSGGGTAMDSGMTLAYDMASQTYAPGSENRVIVLSDGDANIGRTHHSDMLETVKGHAEEGITLTTVGFGMGNYKDTMMERLANEGDGNYFYVDSAEEAQEVFGEDLASTIHTIAKDVKIQVEFNPDVVYAYRLIGYENRDIADVDFRNDAVDAGEIGRGHEVTALYDIVLLDEVPAGEIATVRIRAKQPGPDSPAREWTSTFSEDSLKAELADSSQSFRMALAAASFAELLRQSPYAQELSWEQVRKLAVSASRDTGEDNELVSLIVEAAALDGAAAVAGR